MPERTRKHHFETDIQTFPGSVHARFQVGERETPVDIVNTHGSWTLVPATLDCSVHCFAWLYTNTVKVVVRYHQV